jgi:dipeptidyl aminopeptidase/acylaminoacyl peptidase
MGENGTSVLMLNQGGTERELSARLLTGSAYRGIGAFVVDPEAQRIAVQALHADDDGADLVVLQADGALVATEQRGFWQQPLGFSSDGLLYITTECPSATVQRYALRRRTERGTIETLLTGSTANTIGAALVQGDALVYARSAAAQGSTPAANGAASQAASELWLLTDNGAARRLLHRAPASITRVAGATSVPE